MKHTQCNKQTVETLMTYQQLWRLLTPLYGEMEAKSVARMVYEVRYGLTWADLLMGRDRDVPLDELRHMAERLLQAEPIQYVLGQTDFCGRTFTVNPAVLIPRPETEELCRWILAAESTKRKSSIAIPRDNNTREQSPIAALDIGTGSGCIAVTLAAELPQAQVSAWDLADSALQVARENALRNNVPVTFQQVDALHITPSPQLPKSGTLHLIVSNPPYICNNERDNMAPNVLEHEPHTALFVPDDDPLLFYRAIAQYGLTALRPDGWLYFEINPHHAAALSKMLSTMSYRDIEIREDLYGKQRFIRAQRSNDI